MKRVLLYILLAVICCNSGYSQTEVDGLEANGHEYVDLGLPSGIKWATCNIGAESPEQVGNYYAWGETVPKKKYKVNNYKFYEMPLGAKLLSGFMPAMKKVTYITEYQTTGDTSQSTMLFLDLEDDIAHITCGGDWRMPSKEDFEELIANCTAENVSVNGVSCLKLTSKIRGYENRSICFPLSDLKNDHPSMSHEPRNKAEKTPSGVCCWTSTIKDSQSKSSYAFFSEKYGNSRLVTAFRYIGMPIRPVWDPNMILSRLKLMVAS